MSNMSYCRFENTSNAMQDCIDALRQAVESGANGEEFCHQMMREEKAAFVRMMQQCESFVQLVDELAQNGEVDKTLHPQVNRYEE